MESVWTVRTLGKPLLGSLIWFAVGMLSCGATQREGANCMQNATRIAEASKRHEVEWQWFALPRESNDIFRQQGLRIIAAEPLWLRAPVPAVQGHLRVIWSGGLVGRVVVEAQWDAKRAEAEMSTLDASARSEYTGQGYGEAHTVINACSTVLSSGCIGPTIESPPQELMTDGSRVTLEYRAGDVVYGIARSNPLNESHRRGLEEVIRCACRVMRLPGGTIPKGIELLCADGQGR